MSLSRGAKLGPYEVLEPVGAGGMGEVYRARDTSLGRDVALKVLHEGFARNSDSIARFRREARVLASLNHPNIAAIYGLEDSNGIRAIVMELVDGLTLADRIAHGPIPLDEALPIAYQIAEALEGAHEQGIVHRDLKPANVKLRPDGVVKVLDFGLAKAWQPVAVVRGDLTDSPTITNPMMTEMGVMLGTPAYMAPEQAKGKTVDRRADIWAFGAVLYEMLSGRRAFQGEDISDTLASVLRQEIDWTAIPMATPPPVRALIGRCLDRDVKRRLRDIGEARIVLHDPGVPAGDAGSGPILVPPQPLWRRALPVVFATIIAGALGGAGAFYIKPSPRLAVTRFLFTPPQARAIILPASDHIVALSPDGAQMVYVADAQLLCRRSMSELDVHAIQGTEGYQSVREPVFSPDGRLIAFYALADQTIKKIAVTGGTAVTICPAASPFGMSWGPYGIVFGQGSMGIMRVSPNGGTPDMLVRTEDGEEADGPQLLPGGQHVLFTLATGTALDRWNKARVVVQSLASGKRKTLVEGGSDARYVPTGHLVYAVAGNLFAVPFDAGRLEVTGGPVPVVEGVRRAAGARTGGSQFSFSDTGTLIYAPGGDVSGARWLIALTDRNGGVEPLKLAPLPVSSPRVSPDGTRIVFQPEDDKEAIVWIYKLSGTDALRRLTFGGNNRFPIWSADGKHVVFQSDREGDPAIFWQSADGSTGTAERLTRPDPGTSHAPESWSPKSDTLLYSVTKGSDVSLWTLSLRDRKATPFGDVHSRFATDARFSPDGHWVAYTSGAGATTAIYVQPFPATGTKYEVFVKGSNNAPHNVAWSPDGKELFYIPRFGGFEAVSVTTLPTFVLGNAVALPRPFRPGPPNSRMRWDVTPSGKFLGLLDTAQSQPLNAAPQIAVVLNWFEELRARVPITK